MWQAIEESEVPPPIAVGLGRSPVLHEWQWYARSGEQAVRWGLAQNIVPNPTGGDFRVGLTPNYPGIRQVQVNPGGRIAVTLPEGALWLAGGNVPANVVGTTASIIWTYVGSVSSTMIFNWWSPTSGGRQSSWIAFLPFPPVIEVSPPHHALHHPPSAHRTVNIPRSHIVAHHQLLGNPTGLGDAAGDMAAFNLMVSNGDTALANGDFTNAVTDYQSAGQAGAVTIGPEIDTQTSNASQSLTQQAWTLNGQLAQIDASTATQTEATNAQNLAHQMQSLYNQALQATPANTPAPSSASNLDVAAGALLQRLQASGCPQTSFAECSAFQQAWNSAGGTPSLTVDGFYGDQTSASLQVSLNIGPNQPPQSAPPGCIAAKHTTVTPPTAPTKPAAPVIVATTPTNWTPWLIAGGVAVLGVGSYALYRYKRKHGHMPRLRAA